ncbi:MerR family DNA-binding transcriptional regulator [Paenibacillus typhae]|nr:MerR family DNA-binding transcriptional regulator [Paenibacillus typhae]
MAFTIKEASDRLGCPAHKIRYYEKEGLLPYIQRDQPKPLKPWTTSWSFMRRLNRGGFLPRASF